MKKVIVPLLLLMVIIGVVLFFSLSTATFTGNVIEVNDSGQLLVDCPIVKFSGSSDDIGYTCGVQTTESTIVTNENGDILTIDDIEVTETVNVVLTKRYFLRKNKNSRMVAAEKITILK
ncbi:hypothetical protein JNUCC1_02807 [Lentibacillus sp. JNUCC-1]|uniref:hypothetical protein n=1 Tax=Lentibacillus sp. JNUCC-1 TaxID=2654513 RepID=UPI0012E8057A|nr:hypothetical protein [Lentibacillus sp. JNUCC-1]MUV38935.1 hypothetical protein [Lentibacillus sp. JNUCC-1]